MMKQPHQEGFTLVETLIAITILLISIVGPMYSVFQAVQTTYIARDQLIATSLAQEGVEYILNRRDSNYLYNVANPTTPVGWLNGLSTCQGHACMVDTTTGISGTPVICAGACTPLNIANTGTNPSNLYNQQTVNGGTPTRFTRTVIINTVSTNEVIVTSTVSWMSAHGTFSVVVNEHLYNWL